jgi:hypothetical protein
MGELETEELRRPFDAVAEDEQRRGEIFNRLTKALKAHFKSCSRERDVQWDRVSELLGAACRGFYDSLATSYLAVEPPINPEHFFSIDGELFGGRTHFDFKNAVKEIKIRRPSHWPLPQMWREDDSPKGRRKCEKFSKVLHQHIRLGPYLEGCGLQERIADGVRHWRPQFERRLATPDEAAGSGGQTEMSTPVDDPRRLTTGGRPRELCAIDPEKVKNLRGKKPKAFFARRCGISEDTLERAERDGMASRRTISAICEYAKGQHIKLKPEDLKTKSPQ